MKSLLLNIPNELLEKILDHFGKRDLYSLSQVCAPYPSIQFLEPLLSCFTVLLQCRCLKLCAAHIVFRSKMLVDKIIRT